MCRVALFSLLLLATAVAASRVYRGRLYDGRTLRLDVSYNEILTRGELRIVRDGHVQWHIPLAGIGNGTQLHLKGTSNSTILLAVASRRPDDSLRGVLVLDSTRYEIDLHPERIMSTHGNCAAGECTEKMVAGRALYRAVLQRAPDVYNNNNN